jgi:deoxyribodipyrimidine photolyase
VTQTFDDLLLVSPQLMVDSDGLPPAALDDFSRLWLERLDVVPQPPAAVEGTFVASGDIQSFDDWADSLAPTPGHDTPAGATAASARLSLEALLTRLPRYRDGPEGAEPGSPVWTALAFGTVSVRQVTRAVLARAATDESSRSGAEAFILDLSRREYAYHRVHAQPDILRAPGPEGEYVRRWLLPIV